jgi:hypothetical protein
MMQDDPDSLLKLIQQHLSWYPLMEPRDIYKLLYQGVMGSEHLLTSSVEYIWHLRSEFERLQPDRNQRLLEPVRPDGTLFRLNLHAFKSRQMKIDLLFSSLIETARVNTGSKNEVEAVWAGFTRWCLHGQVGRFEIKRIYQFSLWLFRMEFPAVHHSEIYRREYQPAYRLISNKYIHMLGLADAS